MEYVADVKRITQSEDGGHEKWVARLSVPGVPSLIESKTEEELRTKLKDVLLQKTQQEEQGGTSYDVKLKRTWRVNITSKKEGRQEDEEDDGVPFWDLFS